MAKNENRRTKMKKFCDLHTSALEFEQRMREKMDLMRITSALYSFISWFYREMT